MALKFKKKSVTMRDLLEAPAFVKACNARDKAALKLSEAILREVGGGAAEKAHYTPSPLIVVLAREKRKKPLSWYYQVVASVRGKRYAKVGYDDWYDEDQLVIIKRFRISPPSI